MKSRAFLLMVAACLAWSSNIVMLSVILQEMNPHTLVILRWLIVVAVLAPFVLYRRGRRLPSGRNLAILALMGLLAVALGNILAFEAYATTTAINIGFISALGPLLIALLSFLLLGERYSAAQVTGSLVALAGCLLSLSRSDARPLLAIELNRGDLYVFLAALANALYAITGKHITREVAATETVFYSSLFGLLLFLPFGAPAVQLGSLGPKLAACVLHTALVATLAARWLFMKSMERLSAAEAGVVQNSLPLFTALFSALFLGLPLEAWHLWGWMVMTAGILLFYGALPFPAPSGRRLPAEARPGSGRCRRDRGSCGGRP